MEIIIKIDGSDSRQFIDAATKFAGAVQSFKPEDILDKVADVLGFLAADDNKDGASSGAPAAENVRVAPDSQGWSASGDTAEQRHGRSGRFDTIMFGDVSLTTQSALEKAGITTVQQLAEFTEPQLRRLPGFSDADIRGCRIHLDRYGLKFRDEA